MVFPRPDNVSLTKLPPSQKPILLVVIDTEEEFNWSLGYRRDLTAVDTISKLDRVQGIFDEFGIRPMYVIDYPVASKPESFQVLKEIADSGRAVIGAHLHPWVNPPHKEELGAFNSYAGNLPRELESAKLARLTETISQNFGLRPSIYKAGRYGLGPNTFEILVEQGYEVDLSVNPPFDLKEDGGPDYSAHPAEPYWVGGHHCLLEIPSSGAYLGCAAGSAHTIYSWANHTSLRFARLPGILSRMRIVDRLRLSPEGYTGLELRKLTSYLFRWGVRVFTFSFHSPSVEPGWTPYVRTRAELDQFLDRCRRYFDYFLGELQGMSMTALDLKQHLLNTL